jgi:hypothetical protein
MTPALSFNGTTNYLTTSSVTAVTTPMTFVVWFVPSALSVQQVIFDGVSAVYVRLQLGGTTPNNVLNGTFGNGSVWGTFMPSGTLNAGVPNFVGLECDNNGNQYLYLNGALANNAIGGTPASSYVGVQFGMQSGGGNNFGGLMFLAGVWRRMIGPAAHARLYAFPFDLLRLGGRPIGRVIGGAATPSVQARSMVMA